MHRISMYSVKQKEGISNVWLLVVIRYFIPSERLAEDKFSTRIG